jgi:hypothetical protein
MSLISKLLGGKGSPDSKTAETPMTVGDRQRMALRPPSFTEMLPYVRYSAQDRVFAMRDGVTLGAMFELTAVATEAQPLTYLQECSAKVQEALQAMPESDASPWIVQMFLSDDRNIDGLNQQLRDYILQQHKANPARAQEILNSPYTQSVLEAFEEHLSLVSRAQGLFTDTLVTGQVWRGQQRRVRCCIYRRFPNLASEPSSPMQQMEAVATTLLATCSEAGVKARRCNGQDFYEWMLPFFNRNVPWAATGAELLKKAPYPGDAPFARILRLGSFRVLDPLTALQRLGVRALRV